MQLTGVSYAAVAEFKEARARPPAGSHVMGLMVDACSNRGVKVISAARSIAVVLVQDWEEKMHSKPKTIDNVTNQIVKDYESLKLHRKITSRSNPSETQLRQAHEFNQRMAREYSIEGLQTSNIPASSAKKEAISSQTNPHVDTALPSKRLRKLQEQDRKPARRTRATFTFSQESSASSSNAGSPWYPPATAKVPLIEKAKNCDEVPAFPQISTRRKGHQVPEALVRVFVSCMAKYKVSERDCRGMFVDIANGLFGQSWELESDFVDDEELEEGVSSNKRRRAIQDVSILFPSRCVFRQYLEDAAILNLKFVAELLRDKNSDVVATMGFDDANKAAGYKHFDVKTTHLTMKNTTTGNRDTYTTGYMENKCHTVSSYYSHSFLPSLP